MPRLVDFALQGETQLNRVAVVLDVRGLRTVQDVDNALAALDGKKVDYEILFLDASDDAIRRRSRRPAASTR